MKEKIELSYGRLSKSKLKVFFIAISRNNIGGKLIFAMDPDFNFNQILMEEKMKNLEVVIHNQN